MVFDVAGAARPGKVVSSVLRYNNCGAAAAAEALDQRRVVRNPAVSTQYAASSYPRRSSACKNERVNDESVEGSNGLQPKPQYIARKVAAAQGGSGSNWYWFIAMSFQQWTQPSTLRLMMLVTHHPRLICSQVVNIRHGMFSWCYIPSQSLKD